MERTFEIFEVTAESEKLKKFREDYLRTLNEPLLYKVISTNPNWFYYRHGIYDVKKMLGDSFFEFALLPTSQENADSLFKFFIDYGPLSTEQVKGIRYENTDTFIYTPSVLMKRGHRFSIVPALQVSRDIYNLAKIQWGDYGAIEDEEISQYGEFFQVSDKPTLVTTERKIKENYENGIISQEEYMNQISKYERQERLVMTLKQGKSTK